MFVDSLGAGRGTGQMGGMSRSSIAALAGLAGFLAYVALVLLLSDLVHELHWTLELVFYAVAGVAWVWPAKRLIVWAMR